MEFKPAKRTRAKLRLGISGPSGAGKTYSALMIANGITPWTKIAIIDSENGSAELYSHLGAYSVLTLEPPYTPEKYIEAIRLAERTENVRTLMAGGTDFELALRVGAENTALEIETSR